MSVSQPYIFKVVTPAEGAAHNLTIVYEVMPDGGAMQIAPCSCLAEAAEVMANYIKSTTKELNDEQHQGP
jgi:hypothetical protein